ncbi:MULTISPECIES: hypothetical protein [unclassified Paenibacillus]|uniref:hypothetical protein n=1 Tax=unclassified Paenibacillus TaxID=185978 RepID=UPI000CFCD268|nr:MULTISPECIES: hypothetical protein [unclassified Paenibacillus]PRA08991.1 hypothetical protein CQ043_03140 [Paenibacillus sp. MYb63]PRA48925.1 hypothetical protein CQ061_11595 [Paenibacillus sp. MYb67]QZN73219.1 hypothetical protein K5K90_17290 [Paenibacillus sp. DR312]
MYTYTDNLIPIMTSMTAPSGRAFSSSYATSGNNADKAFDNSDVYGYVSGNGSVGYIGYEFVNPIRIGKYIVRSLSATYFPHMPKNWTFEGSNDDINWTVLDTQVNQTWTTANTNKEYVIDVSKAKLYKMYRLNWTANNGGAQVVINELKMFGLNSLIKFLISSGDEYYSIENMYKDNAIPAMTSNTSPSGVAEASSTYSTFYPWKSFDRLVDQNGWVTASGVLVGWLSYEFPSTVTITGYSIKSGTTPAYRLPKNWTFEGWDGTKWAILDTRINEPNFTGEEFRMYYFKNKFDFKKYRINVTANQGAGDFLAIGDFGMYESERYITSVESSEVSILEHGMNKGMIIDLEDEFSERRSLVKECEKIGSGKVFKKKIDTNKVPIKKASII